VRSVADDIRGAQETAQATERLSAEVVGAASVIDEQADKLRNRIGQFVAQLRDTGEPVVTGQQRKLHAEEPTYRLAAG
jgi:hypothetical protein